MRILVVEDDEILRDAVEASLSLAGFTVDSVDTVADARSSVSSWPYDAVVLDLALPDGSGLELLADWRAAENITPVLLLTARNATQDRITGLDGGADDYLGKPFDVDELLARLRALLRRPRDHADVLDVPGGELDLSTRSVLTASGGEVPLSEREAMLLSVLARSPRRVFTRRELVDSVFEAAEDEGVVDTYVHYLRRKLHRGVVETVRGLGYRLGSR